MADDERPPFLARWSKRKAQVRSGAVVPPEPVPPEPPAPDAAQEPHPGPLCRADPTRPSTPPPGAPWVEAEKAPVPLPTMDDVAALTDASDYSRFVAPGVDAGVRNAAMKKLFSDPHFNVMDRLDIYIDDYNQPDPIPESMLRQMVQSKFLGLFDHEQDTGKDPAAPVPTAPSAGAAEAAADNPPGDDHADLQLQPDDAAGRPGPDQGAGPGKV